MDETQNHTQQNTTPNPVVQQPVPQPGVSHEPTPPPKKDRSFGTLVVIGASVIALGTVAMLLLGKSDTGTQNTNGINPNEVIATVNGTDIVGADLTTSISQISATAQLQGIDTTDPEVQEEIQSQAVTMLVNTALLEQEAEERGIVVTDADVESRIAALVQEIGSEEALMQRMEALGIDDETLNRDVHSELMIQALLEQVFAEENITVTEEEITSLYESTTSGDATAPALEEVRTQVENQIRASKEQQVIDGFLATLRSEADIEIAE